ncbi:MAG: hypothetical protein RI883_2532 [Bacteroidota bacterium]|jgi:Tfp pilus assembly protein PilP
MKLFFLIISILAISACNSKDEQFCKCLKSGEELNDFSSKLFQDEITTEKADKLKGLKEVKKKECADYQLMSGKEMLEKKVSCKD